MTCVELRKVLQDFVDGELEPAAAARAHLADCSDCAREAERLKSWSGEIGAALQREADGVEAAPGARAALAASLTEAARQRPLLLSRLAAAAMIVLSAGLVLWSLAARAPSAEQVAVVVDRLKEQAAGEAELRFLEEATRRDLAEARKLSGDQPAAKAVRVGVWNLEERLGGGVPAADAGLDELIVRTGDADPAKAAAARVSLRRLEPSRLPELRFKLDRVQGGDRAFVAQLAQPPSFHVAVTQMVNGTPVTVTQAGDGSVKVTLPGRSVEAKNMGELQARHAELCREFSIAGREGFVVVGSNAAGADWKGQLDLHFKNGSWDEGVQWEAWRAGMRAKVRDAGQLEARLKESQERIRRQGALPAPPAARVDVPALLKQVQALTRQELERNRERMEGELKRLEARLQEAHELRERARGLRLFAEEAGKE